MDLPFDGGGLCRFDVGLNVFDCVMWFFWALRWEMSEFEWIYVKKGMCFARIL